MQKQGVFFIGDVALDEYYQAPYFPAIKEKIIVHSLPPKMGGSIANAACVFASYGCRQKPYFMTALNSGSISKILCEDLEKSGLDTSFMVWDDSLPDSKCIIILAEDEHTVFIPTLGLQKMEVSPDAMEALKKAEYIYTNLCECKPLTFQGKNSLNILKELKENGCKIWCDLDVADINGEELEFLAYFDTLFLNEKGEENLQRLKNSRKMSDEPLQEWLFDMGISTLVLTRAENGCIVYESRGESFTIPGCRVKVEDVTGAGDTFCSSFLYATLQGSEIRQAAEFANYAAARAVTQMGERAGAAGLKAVQTFIKEQG